MRESRTYGSGRGACDETHVPTATRREFITLVGGAAAWPVAALAQPRVLPLIGILNSGAEQLRPDQFDGLHRGLKETGFVAGTNVTVDISWR